MRGPAEFFRRNQKVFLAVLTGLAILSFVVSDSTNGQVQNMPPMLVVVTATILVGGAAWIIGLAKDKASEFGLVGAVIGLLLGFVVNAYRPEARGLSQVEQQRAVKEVYVAATVAQRRGERPIDNLDFRHLLLDEAAQRGIQLRDDVGLSQLKAAGMTREDYDAMKRQFGVSDSLISSALKNAAEVDIMLRLYGQGEVMASPMDWWDAYQKLNVRESALVAAVPVESFVDAKAAPKEADLISLFEEFKKNYPNLTIEGRLEEGRPGFLQPPRVKASYLVANIEDFEKLVPEPTKEEIEARYKESYAQPLPPKGGMTPGGPALPSLDPPVLPELDMPKPSSPKGEPGAEAPAKPADPPAAPEKKEPSADAAKPAADAPKPATEEKKPEAKPAEEAKPAGEAKPPEEAKPEEKKPNAGAQDPKSSLNRRADGTVEVALVDDAAKATDGEAKPAAAPAPEAKPAEETKPAPEAPKADTPTADAPKADAPKTDDAKPSAEAPAAAKGEDPTVPPPPPAASTVGGVSDDPAPPSSTVRPLDDDLRQTIKEQIIRDRAEQLAKKNIRQGSGLVQSFLDRSRAPKISPKPGDKPPVPPTKDEDPDYLTPEEAKAAMAKAVQDLKLEVIELPAFAARDIIEGKDHPFKNASVAGGDWRSAGRVVEALFTPGTPLNTMVLASSPQDGIEFAIWKSEQVDAHEPKALEEIRDQVATAWRSHQARKLAEARAKELAAKAKEAAKPLTEALQNETVTGQKDSLLVDVKPTGSFSWMTFFFFGGGFQTPPPRISTVAGVDKPGESFMKTVFKDIKVGEAGVAANADKSVYYVVQVESRDDAKPEEVVALRERMIKDRMSSTSAQAMAEAESSMYRGNPFARLIPQGEAEIVEE